jgi:hypothetical protein
MTTEHPLKTDRVYRPLGLTVAIAATAIFYGLLPIAEVYFLRRLDVATDEAYLLGGVSISTWTWLQAIVGGVILVICGFAWWGRPPWIRFVLIGAILVPTVLTLFRIIEAWTREADPLFGGQTEEMIRSFVRCQMPALIVVPLYVLWYLNRAPARAFYRRLPLSALQPGWVEPAGDTRAESPPPTAEQ